MHCISPFGSLEVIGGKDSLSEPLASLEVICGQDTLSKPLASLEVIGGQVSLLSLSLRSRKFLNQSPLSILTPNDPKYPQFWTFENFFKMPQGTSDASKTDFCDLLDELFNLVYSTML